MKSRTFAVALLGALSLSAAACGGNDDMATPRDDGVVEVTMRDNRFEPDEIRVNAGQKVTFRFENEGAVVHEAYIGDEDAQETHEQEMTPATELPGHGMDMGDTEPGHGDADALRVEPGEAGTLEHIFEQLGTVLIGCHEPGHWESGMRARIDVV